MFFFFFNDTATTEIYTLSLHDALPILSNDVASRVVERRLRRVVAHAGDLPGHEFQPIRAPSCREIRGCGRQDGHAARARRDRKSTRLNSSHLVISYAVFCLKKKKTNYN